MGLVLLSPCDSYELQRIWLDPKEVPEQQVMRLKAEGGSRDSLDDWLPLGEYGIRQGGEWTYPLPVTRAAFLSIAEGPPFRLMRLTKPAHFHLEPRVLVILGGDDKLQTVPCEIMVEYFASRARECRHVCIPEADHGFVGFEDILARHIAEWVRRA